MPGYQYYQTLYGIDALSKDQIKDLAASVRDRLLQISRDRAENYQFVLIRYANERFLFRLSKSPYRDQFIVKGAILFLVWNQDQYRPTRDIDLLGLGDNSENTLRMIFQGICKTEVEPDGLTFNAENIRISEIREGHNYHGQRIQFPAHLGSIIIPMQFDVGFGDTVVPEPSEVIFPTLLNFSAPNIQVYSKESVVAEKLQIMVEFGIASSRMKDFYDLYVLARYFDFHGTTLLRAIKSTFKRRATKIPKNKPVALSDDFSRDKNKQQQWIGFISRNNVHQIPDTLGKIVSFLSNFLLPPLEAVVTDSDTWEYFWKSGGPWDKLNENN